jgi:MFS family permease
VSDKVQNRRFWRIAGAGATFQGGVAAIDSATVVASLVFHLTGSAVAVGFASAILRLGWLFPQILVGWIAQRSRRRMSIYIFGAAGRAVLAGAIGVLLLVGTDWSPPVLAAAFLLLWTLYAFVSGVVAVPYNDIVARSIPSSRRSRVLAWRFFGGGVLALGAAGFVSWSHQHWEEPTAFGLIFLSAAAAMTISTGLFVSAGEPALQTEQKLLERKGFWRFLAEGIRVFGQDQRFRLFLSAHWLGGTTLMALPFYMVASLGAGIDAAGVGVLLGAQTLGAMASNPLWGWIGDRLGKLNLLQVVAVLRAVPPLTVLTFIAFGADLIAFAILFIVIGAMMNGVTIGYLGYLMEISPDDRRPAYSAYFNAFASPAALLPVFGGVVISLTSIHTVFVVAIAAAAAQCVILSKIGKSEQSRAG